MKPDSISIDEARSLTISSLGLQGPRPRRAVREEDIAGVIRLLGVVQLDFVSVVAPAHLQVMFSRLGPFHPPVFDRAVYASGAFTEQWAHEASIIPVETWPLLRHKMAVRRLWPYGFDAFAAKHGEYCESILSAIREKGPVTAAGVPHPDGVERRIKGAWYSVPRATLEMYFVRGRLAVARRAGMARVFDLPERVLPAACLAGEPDPHEAQRQLLRIAARSYGVATADDLADYFRSPVRELLPRIAELVEAGMLLPVSVEGWRQRAYLHRDAKPRPCRLAALISPFDPLVWYRRRALRLFHFEHRFEIFVPQEKRKYGVYVLPFLLNDRLVARVDLKTDRAQSRLLVLSAVAEPGISGEDVAAPLAAELRSMIEWLGLEKVVAGRRGNLARALRAQL
jgi:uncharacterized protein YcaQ